MSTSIPRRRLALFALFFIPGVSIASWVTRTPAIRDATDASTAQMGLILLGLSVGSMVGILCSGALVAGFGAKAVILAGTTCIVIGLPIIGLGTHLGSPDAVTIGLAIFGLGIGGGEVAMNVEGAEVEKITTRTFLPVTHGFFSVGTVVGALLGILASASGFSVALHLVLVGGVSAGLLCWSIRAIPAGTGKTSRSKRVDRFDRVADDVVWKDPRLLLFGCVVLAMALAEGTANDWLPLVMVDGHGLEAAHGSAIYAVFAAAMALGRFCGNPVVRRLGKPRVLFLSAMFGAAGIALVSLVDSQAVAIVAVVLWGLGTSLGFPVAISAAGESGPHPAARVALASTVGYLGFLVGPPFLGLLGEAVGLRGALLVPMAVLGLVLFLARAARPNTCSRWAVQPTAKGSHL